MSLKRIRPPQHRAGIKHIYIAQDDSAWDLEAIEADVAKMKETGIHEDEHPVNIFWLGESRFDLGAAYPVNGEQKCASDYIKDGETPTEFEIIPLRMQDWNQARDMYNSRGSQQTFQFCAERGLQACSDLNLPTTGAGKSQRVSRKGFEILAEISIELPAEVGMAVYMLSSPPTEAEKKRLGS